MSQAPTLAWVGGSSPVELRARSGSADTGAPAGSVLRAPGMTGQVADVRINHSVAISGRTGMPGVYTAYADDDGELGELLLWRVGDPLPRVMAVSARAIGRVALTPAPDGSLIRLRCPDAPKAKRRPAVAGVTKAGRTLRCRLGAWKPKPRRYRYSWLRNRTIIPGATKRTLEQSATTGGPGSPAWSAARTASATA